MNYNVIDADGHILEPPDIWEQYIDPKFREAVPNSSRLKMEEIFRVEGDDAIDLGGGKKRISFGGVGAIGAREGKGVAKSIPYIQGRKGGFDPHARIPDMEARASMLRFCIRALVCSWARSKIPIFAAATCPRVQSLAGGLLQTLPGATVWRRDVANAVRRRGVQRATVRGQGVRFSYRIHSPQSVQCARTA